MERRGFLGLIGSVCGGAIVTGAIDTPAPPAPGPSLQWTVYPSPPDSYVIGSVSAAFPDQLTSVIMRELRNARTFPAA